MNILSLYNQDSGIIEFTDGAEVMSFEMPDHEDGTALIISNGSENSAVVKVKAGNSIYAMDDLDLTVEASDIAVVNLKNSGRFKNVHGENSGKVIINISGPSDVSDVKLCVISL